MRALSVDASAVREEELGRLYVAGKMQRINRLSSDVRVGAAL